MAGSQYHKLAVAALALVSALSTSALANSSKVDSLSVDSPFRLRKVWIQPQDQSGPAKGENEQEWEEEGESNTDSRYEADDDSLNMMSQSFAGSTPSSEEEVVPAGTQLAALIDKACARTSSDENPITRAAYVDEASDSGLKVEAYSLVVEEETTVDELAVEAENDSCVLGLTTDDEVESEYVPNDSRYNEQKQLDAIQAERAWDIMKSQPGFNSIQDVVVAIVDSGIDYRHPDLRNMMWKGSDGRHGYNFIARNSDPYDDHHHGTHVAGLVAAEMDNGMGVAGVMGTKTKLMAVKVTDGSGRGSTSRLANGIRYAADNGADILNISLGSSSKSAILLDALRYAVSKGAAVFVAAGNASKKLSDRAWMSPASYGKDIPGVIAVGSTDSVRKKRSGFSNYSPIYVEIGAPGSNGILSTFPGSGYQFLQGTSMASPVAAGAGAMAVALMRAKGMSPTPAAVEEALVRSGDKLSELSKYVKNGTHLNIEKMAQSITGKSGGSVSPAPIATRSPAKRAVAKAPSRRSAPAKPAPAKKIGGSKKPVFRLR